MTRALVVSDSSTLILTVKAGFVDGLVKAFTVFIPEIVFQECVERGKEKGRQDAFELEGLIEKKLLQVKKPSKKNLNKVEKKFNLHAGERHAIALALDLNAEFLLTDDFKAMNACMVLGIKFITALSLLLEFYKKNILEEEKTKNCFESLENFGWYSPEIIRLFKKKMLEVKK